MKRILYLFLLIFILLQGNSTTAQTLIAVHNETGSTFYASLDTAIIKSKAGDYIYLPGGSFKISQPIDKQLQIVGVGHNPDSCAATGITQVTGDFTIKNGSNHGSITGLKIYGNITFTVSAPQAINYFSIERCNIGSVNLTSQTLNIFVNECVIHGGISGNNIQGLLVSKCIIEGDVSGFVANTHFINNIFLNSTYYPTSGCFFKNNIFLASGPSPSATSTALYQNNSFTSTVSSLYNCHNNIVCATIELFKIKTKTGFDYDQDYHILDASKAHNSGTDGTDLGIYGTGSPWKEGSVPSYPHIQTKIISTINGVQNVKIKVSAQDY